MSSMENVIKFNKKGTPMITLNYKVLNSEGFNQALATLASQTGFSDFQAAYNVAKLTRQFGEELKIARELYAKWTEKFMVKDENGQPKRATVPHPLCPWEIKEGMTEEFNKEMDNFLKTEITIKATPIKIQDLGQIRLSPTQVLSLEPVFDPAAFEKPEASKH